jgi:hypothetical protein
MRKRWWLVTYRVQQSVQHDLAFQIVHPFIELGTKHTMYQFKKKNEWFWLAPYGTEVSVLSYW